MTTIATDIPAGLASVASPDIRPPKPVRAAAVDASINAARRVRPQSVTDQRTQPRLSIAELNAMDMDQVRERLARTAFDDRGPVTRFLDMLDVPRNFVVGRILANNIRKQKANAGETGTFGEGKVYFSDVLDDMGVRNPIVKGVLGFVGDVALDPLTYAGPPGWGAKAISGGGKIAQWTRRATRGIVEAGEAIRAGRVPASRFAAEYLSHLKPATAEDAVKALREDDGQLVKDIFSAVGPETPAAEAERINAAKRWYQAEGRAAAPGIRIGKSRATGKLGVEASGYGRGTIDAGTGVFHVPFTDIGVFVPAITPRARAGAGAAALATVGRYAGPQGRATTPEIRAVEDAANSIVQTREQIRHLGGILRGFDEEEAAIRSQVIPGNATAINAMGQPIHPDARLVTIQRERATLSDAVKQLRRQVDLGDGINQGPLLQNLRAAVDALKASPAADPNEMLYAERIARGHEAAADATRWETMMQRPELKEFRERWTGLHKAFTARVEATAKAAGIPTERAAEMEYPGFLASLDARNAEVFSTSESTLNAADAFVDALHGKMLANMKLAEAAKLPLIASMNEEDRAAASAAKMLMGWGPEDTGYEHAMVPLGEVAGSIFDRLDQKGRYAAQVAKARMAAGDTLGGFSASLRRAFGVRSGTQHELNRALQVSGSDLTNRAAVEIGQGVVRDVMALGLKEQQAQTARELILALMFIDKAPPEILAVNPRAAKIVQDAMRSGLLDPAVNPDVARGIRALADKYRPMLDAARAAEMAADPTLRNIPNYVPNVVHPGGRAAIARQSRALGAARESAAGVAHATTQAFERPRGTNVYRWVEQVQGPGGTVRDVQHQFMEGQRVYTDPTVYSPDFVSTLDAKAQQHIRDVRESIAAYEKLSPHLRPEPLPLSPFDVNDYIERGGMRILTGGEKIMDEDAASALAGRFAQSERFHLQNYIRDWAKSARVVVEKSEIAKILAHDQHGATVRTAGGATARIEKTRAGDIVLHLAGERLRRPRMDANLSALYDPMGGFGAHEVYQGFYPEAYANVIENAGNAFKDEQTFSGVVEAAERASRVWKQLTLLHPSWTINDTIGNIVLAVNLGVNPARLASHILDGFKIAIAHNRGDENALRKIAVKAGGLTIDGRTLANEAGPGVLGASRAGEASTHVMGNGVRVQPIDYSVVRDPRRALRAMYDNQLRIARAEAQAGHIARLDGIQKFNAMKGMVLDEGWANRVWKPWVHANAIANDGIRVASMLALVDDGHGVGSAARAVADGMLDMSTMTSTEKKIRRFVPFYAWMRASGAYGVRQLLENPKFFTMASRVKHAIEEAANGDANLPEHMRPRWLRDMQALQFGTEPDSRKALLITQMLPNEAATYMGLLAGSPVLGQQAFQDAIQYFGNSLGPPFKQALELASGKEWYTDRTISANPDEGDLTPGEYLLGQIRPLRELGVGNVRRGPLQQAFGRSPLEGVSRVLQGGRVQPLTDEWVRFQNIRELKTQEESIRKRIRVAEREGNKEASLHARVRLLALYREMESRGLADEVPKWASSALHAAG